MKSSLLEELYSKYDIANLKFGGIHDKLGDLYEEYCVRVLEDANNLKLAKRGAECGALEVQVFSQILEAFDITDFSSIEKIEASTKIPHRETRGLSKTDVILTVYYNDGHYSKHALSCKQSTVAKIAFAEFDVNTICREIGIEDELLRALLLKHQNDKSAKNFTPAEKEELRARLLPIAREFVRWVITGSTELNPTNLVYPTAIIKFKLKKPKDKSDIHVENGDFDYISFGVCSVEDYIDGIMFTPKGTPRSGGFGTGLAWTYATGSGGYKIQFKA